MNTLLRCFAAALMFVILVHAQDRRTVDPDMKVFAENERVRVQEHRLSPGEKVSMHSHPAHVIVVLNDSRWRMTLADGRKLEGENTKGQAFFMAPVAHAVENIGTSDIWNIVIELKEARPSGTTNR